MTAYNYIQHETVGLSYTQVVKNAERAYSTAEVARLVNRGKLTVELAIMNGDIERPQMTYGIGEGRIGKPYQFRWSEKNIWELHAFLSTLHRGRPRKDGRITSSGLPTPQELRAAMRQEVVLYVENDNGEFVPTWEAKQF